MDLQDETAPSAAYRGFGGRAGEFTSDSEPWWPPQPSAAPGAPNVIASVPFGASV